MQNYQTLQLTIFVNQCNQANQKPERLAYQNVRLKNPHFRKFVYTVVDIEDPANKIHVENRTHVANGLTWQTGLKLLHAVMTSAIWGYRHCFMVGLMCRDKVRQMTTAGIVHT